MDCDTTGIEPDLGLVKLKKLVGGGTMSIVNQTIPRALRRLGYDAQQAADIIAYIDEQRSVLGAPHLKAEHVSVFACSMGDNTIHYSGHVRMMGAVQPFISGAISKTVNMPSDVTIEDVEQLHIDAWKLGIKAVAIYRDNCKVGQPLSTLKKEPAALAPALSSEAQPVTEIVERIVERIVTVKEPVREKLPRNRASHTFEFRVADCKGFVTVGEYADGRPGEIFLRVSKQGSTLAGIMDAFAISVSHGLQYGVPLRSFVEAMTNMRFEPAGMTDDPDLRFASSVVDYIFRRLAVDYLSPAERAELNILTVNERTQPTLPGVEETVVETRQGQEIPADPPSIESASSLLDLTDSAPSPEPEPVPVPKVSHSDAPYCMQCGVQMQRAGSCHACPSCGSTSGCS
jgi:ribonucleoside-diphosphate reductase alpha chain